LLGRHGTHWATGKLKKLKEANQSYIDLHFERNIKKNTNLQVMLRLPVL
jgi:hypothetical protein